jgi:glycosyltransferase involved in cell wall biosynthesis
VRVLIFHGYLLGGTGSNVYNAKLAEALAGMGHEVHLLSQDRDPARLGFVDATADWDQGRLQVTELDRPLPRAPGSCTVYRPNIGRLLPVYVADRYEGMDARPFPDCSDEEIEAYVDANVRAVRDVAERVRPEAALANHLIMGPYIMRRALEGSAIPYAVKVHGSALEYTVKPHPERFLDFAREGLDGARTVLVGSRHTAESLWSALSGGAPADLPSRTRLGPPGVDIAAFRPREPDAAAQGLRDLVARLSSLAEPESDTGGADEGDAFSRSATEAARALARIDPETDLPVAFVGKLIVSKGVDLLVAAWPLVNLAVPRARLVVVGFGAYREGIERLIAALVAGDLDAVREIARRGRELEGGPSGTPLSHLLAFIDSLADDERESYLRAAAAMDDRVLLTGRLEHAELADLLPACEAQVVPSTFPESFGMVAVEAAACGVLPVSADHSGLAEVTRTLAGAVGSPAAGWLSFGLGPACVRDLADCLIAWLGAPEPLRTRTRATLAQTASDLFSWQGVARGVLVAAEGRLDELLAPAPL